ncbi:MAG: ECF transporter S component [Oscillospiraceae bacterium]|nr:ECF transporter S component [Oscillospiraceae bacterium]
MKKQGFSTYTTVVVGMMAAMVFVTSGMRIVIPIDMDNAAVHFGNIFCLLSGILLGGVRGGLAAGIGSAIFDLSNPLYVRSAPFTFLFKFLMAYTCGKIAHSAGKNGEDKKRNLIAGVLGQTVYLVLYLGKGFISKMLEGAVWQAAAIVQLAKLPASGFNAVVAVAVSVLLAPIFFTAMKKSGIYQKLYCA